MLTLAVQAAMAGTSTLLTVSAQKKAASALRAGLFKAGAPAAKKAVEHETIAKMAEGLKAQSLGGTISNKLIVIVLWGHTLIERR